MTTSVCGRGACIRIRDPLEVFLDRTNQDEAAYTKESLFASSPVVQDYIRRILRDWIRSVGQLVLTAASTPVDSVPCPDGEGRSCPS